MDKLPMLVPPAATKTPFYKNRLLAAQCAQAAEALRAADELVLMGYSIPVTDLTVRTLIATQFKGRIIVPVNQDPDIVVRARELGDRGSPPDVIDAFIDPSVLEKWTNTFSSRAGEDLHADFDASPYDAVVFIRSHLGHPLWVIAKYWEPGCCG